MHGPDLPRRAARSFEASLTLAPQGDGREGALPADRLVFFRSSLVSSHITFLSFHHPITSRFRAAFGARIVSFPGADPERGGRRSAARRHWVFDHAGEARCRVTTRGDPVATGIAPLGAPPWRFPAAGPRFNSGSVHRIHVATRPPARSQDLADWVPYLPRRGSLRRPRDATPRSVWWIVSGDAPHERERIWCSIDSICSQ